MIETALEYPAIIGKLPAHGDFIARGVAYGARDDFDRWLSSWMQAGRDRHGRDFDAAYEVAAPFLFEGERCTAILMPSMDAVGRLYPILAVTGALCRTQEVYDCLISGLQDALPSDGLRNRLCALKEVERSTARLEWFLPEGAEPSLPSPGEVAGWSSVEGNFM